MEKIGHLHDTNLDFDNINKALALAYSTISQAKLLMIISSSDPPKVKVKQLDEELKSVAKLSQAFKQSIRGLMSKAIIKEAQSVMLDS